MDFKYTKNTLYKNATQIKMSNKSVTVVSNKNGTFGLRFRILDGSLENRVITTIIKNKVVETYMNLSDEASIALCVALKKQIERKLKIKLKL